MKQSSSARQPQVGGGKFWWKAESADAFKDVCAAVRWLDQNQSHHSERNLRNMRAYNDFAATGLRGGEYLLTSGSERRDAGLNLNIVRAVIDTMVAQTGTNRPRTMFLTEDGNESDQRKGRLLTQYIDGQFYGLDQYDTSQEVITDAGVFGSGFEKIYEEDGKICAERTFPDDLLFDDRDSRHGNPRQAFHVVEIPREVAVERYGKRKKEIASAGSDLRQHSITKSQLADVVDLAESWHLPSGPDANDGRHIICVDNATLLDEPYTRDKFPFVDLPWSRRRLGFIGQGIAEQLEGIQSEITYLLRKLQNLMTLATSQVWIQKGTKIVKSQLTNEDWAAREYVGAPPIFMTVQSVSPEYFTHLWQLYSKAFEIIGQNTMMATSTKPAGLDSGKSIIEYNDTLGQRQLAIAQRYEKFHMRVAEHLIDLAKIIDARGDGDYRIMAKSRRGVVYIKWPEVNLERDRYIMQVYPTNFLPKTPSGKWQLIDQMMDRGFLTQEEAAGLLDYPDLESVTSVRNAPFEYVQMILEDILEKGIPRSPDAFTPLAMAVRYMPMALLKAERNGVEESRLELLRRYIEQAQRKLTPPPAAIPATAQQALPAQAMPAQPNMAQGMPPAMGAPLAA